MKNPTWGILLIVIGIILIIQKMFFIQFFSWQYFWPIFVLIPGLSFEFSYFFKRKAPGTLVPGGILTTYGILFFFETFTNWNFSDYTWPVYPLGVAIGLFQLYLHSGRNSGILIPVSILTAVSAISFISMLMHGLSWLFQSSLVWGGALIVVGIIILFKSLFSRRY